MRELIAALHNPSLDLGADLRVTVHSRFVQPFLDVTLLFLGLPWVLTRESRNIFLAAGLCILVVAVFLLVVLGCQALGTSYLLSPALAVWCPLLIFAPLARVFAGALWR
jgi:lipopolysaccharide export system permease protein